MGKFSNNILLHLMNCEKENHQDFLQYGYSDEQIR